MSNASVLVIDDDANVGSLVALLLEMSGFSVRVSMDGRQALAELGVMPHRDDAPPAPDAIVLDFDMPGFDGFEVMRRLRESEATRHVPVIMLTGADQDPDEGFRFGAASFLRKPFDNARIVDVVREACAA